MSLNESTVEKAALSWFEELGYAVAPRPKRGNGLLAAVRGTFLPKFLSGRICVREIEELEEAIL
jgi:hypothetical protein